MAIAEQPRIIGLAIAESLRRMRRRLFGGQGILPSLGSQTPDRLLLAPRDLNTADPTVAQDIYAGIFHFSGRSMNTGGTSPFQLPAPSEAWRRELHSFSWLRHLHSADDAISTNNAQVLVKDWILQYRRPSRVAAWDVETTGQRLIAWLSHSVPIVQNADLSDYRRFMRSIGTHIRFLRRATGQASDGMPRLTACIALAYAAACVSGSRLSVRTIWKNLDQELMRQIKADGVHISRNPAVLADILAMLLPLRESMVRLGQVPSREFVSAIDRIALAIRYFRLGDGSIARFNGASVTPHDLVATVMRYDEGLDSAPGTAEFSGYQRLCQNGSIIVMDAGKPPPGELSSQAHAGMLSFEMSSGNTPIIVNCGVPPIRSPRAVMAARSTAAHSTLTLNDQSSCRFNVGSVLGRYLENRIISGPSRVTCTPDHTDETLSIRATHDGYVRKFGLVHERMLALTDTGCSIMGCDRLFRRNGKQISRKSKDEFAIRFHLHPSVAAAKTGDGSKILLSGAGGENWVFTCVDVEPELEESIFFAVASGSRRTTQIVLQGRAVDRDEVRWVFSRRGMNSLDDDG